MKILPKISRNQKHIARSEQQLETITLHCLSPVTVSYKNHEISGSIDGEEKKRLPYSIGKDKNITQSKKQQSLARQGIVGVQHLEGYKSSAM